MSTPVTRQPQHPIELPDGVTLTLHRDGRVVLTQGPHDAITLASLDDARALLAALTATVGW